MNDSTTRTPSRPLVAAFRDALLRVDVSPAARTLALVFAHYMNHADGSTHVGHRTLQAMWGIDPRGLQHTVAELADAHLIEVQHRVGPRGANVYASTVSYAADEPDVVVLGDGSKLGKSAADDVRAEATQRGSTSSSVSRMHTLVSVAPISSVSRMHTLEEDSVCEMHTLDSGQRIQNAVTACAESAPACAKCTQNPRTQEPAGRRGPAGSPPYPPEGESTQGVDGSARGASPDGWAGSLSVASTPSERSGGCAEWSSYRGRWIDDDLGTLLDHGVELARWALLDAGFSSDEDDWVWLPDNDPRIDPELRRLLSGGWWPELIAEVGLSDVGDGRQIRKPVGFVAGRLSKLPTDPATVSAEVQDRIAEYETVEREWDELVEFVVGRGWPEMQTWDEGATAVMPKMVSGTAAFNLVIALRRSAEELARYGAFSSLLPGERHFPLVPSDDFWSGRRGAIEEISKFLDAHDVRWSGGVIDNDDLDAFKRASIAAYGPDGVEAGSPIAPQCSTPSVGDRLRAAALAARRFPACSTDHDN